MPLIDLHCLLGTSDATRAVAVPDAFAGAAAARGYADRFDVKRLCFAAAQAASDFEGGLADLLELLSTDARFSAWLSLSIHQPELAASRARSFLVKPEFCGTLLEQHSDADLVTSGGGRETLNALRRYSKPVLLSIATPAGLEAALQAAREFSTLKFVLAPRTQALTRVAPAAMKEVVSTLLLPSSRFVERDVIALAVATLGERRVAWCSDWGLSHPAAAIGMIRDSALSQAQRERVGFRNANDLLA